MDVDKIHVSVLSKNSYSIWLSDYFNTAICINMGPNIYSSSIFALAPYGSPDLPRSPPSSSIGGKKTPQNIEILGALFAPVHDYHCCCNPRYSGNM